MKILALDTSGTDCSAALMIGDEIAQRLEHAPRRHGELILPMLKALLEQAGVTLAELDAIAYSRGPGSFTGVRIAAAVAQGIAFGAGRPTIGVSTLQATAAAAMEQTGQTQIACALDARMSEVYWGLFEATESSAESVVGIGEELVIAPEATPQLPTNESSSARQGSGQPPTMKWCAAGNGWSLYPDLRQRHRERIGVCEPGIRAEARDLLLIARHQVKAGVVCAAREALPVYLRNRVTYTGPSGASTPG